MTNKAPYKHYGCGNTLVFDLATWRDRVPPDAIVPGCVGPLVFGGTRGFILYIWDANPPAEGEQRINYVVPKRLLAYNKIPQISDYDPREHKPVKAYLQHFRRAKDPAAVAAYASWRRTIAANRHELRPPFMVDVDDAEFYFQAHHLQWAALPRTPQIVVEEADLKAGYRKRLKYKTSFRAEQIYVTSACDTEVYARLGPKEWTKVAASHFDVRNPETVTALRALGLASKGFERWALARDVSHGGTYAGSSNILRRISDVMRDDEQAVPPCDWGGDEGADCVVG